MYTKRMFGAVKHVLFIKLSSFQGVLISRCPDYRVSSFQGVLITGVLISGCPDYRGSTVYASHFSTTHYDSHSNSIP